jgi:hypothetical protein
MTLSDNIHLEDRRFLDHSYKVKYVICQNDMWLVNRENILITTTASVV